MKHSTTNAAARDFSDYDAGLLNDFGGGNVEWWQDYLRAEIERANEWWRSQTTLTPQQGGEQEAHIETLRAMRESGGCVDDDAWVDAVDAAIAAIQAETP